MKVSEAEVLREIQRVAERELGLGRPVLPSDRLVEDLRLDSMTLIALAVGLEDAFRVALSDEDAMRIDTVAGLIRYVVAQAETQRALDAPWSLDRPVEVAP